MKYPTIQSMTEQFHFDTSERDTEMALKWIRARAQPWLNAIGGERNLREHKLWRGVRKGITNWERMPVRDNRRPLGNGGQKLMDTFDNLYLKKAGATALRHNSVMCTGDEDHAWYFGDPYIVIPEGKFHFTWSPLIHDLNVWFEENTNQGMYREPEFIDQFTDGDMNLDIRVDTDLIEAIESNNEICLRAGHVALFDEAFFREVMQLMLDDDAA